MIAGVLLGVAAIVAAAEATPVREFLLSAGVFSIRVLDVNFSSPPPD